ncbi:MAG: thioredoxin fold domain-containing protein [Xanthomonadales bacterium]|nr:thioredoxin fold domain-containing protein [Xanthomonadales bacterium]MBK7144155.1 thioredoxin fold domain-containing protein [Xanthomonadales bacterium]MCC6561077.1 thioredoxin fold domain-containing protein [Xanthomonadales bacterium]
MFKRVLFSLAIAASATVQADAASEAKVREAIKTLVPSAQIDSLVESKLTGFYEVTLSGQVLYVSADGKYLVQGMVYDIANKRDLTEEKKSGMRQAALAGVPKNRLISFPAKAEKHRVIVFTDIDCGYCRKLHQQIAEYNNLGITVDYLFFPRSGLNTPSYDKAVTVWCAADRNKAFTDAKAGVEQEKKTCDNPIAEDFELGQKLGVNGTPMIVARDGSQIGGYLAPAQMLERLTALDLATK